MARLRCACLDLQAFVSRLPTIGSVENAARFSTLRLNPGYSSHEGGCGGFGLLWECRPRHEAFQLLSNAAATHHSPADTERQSRPAAVAARAGRAIDWLPGAVPPDRRTPG